LITSLDKLEKKEEKECEKIKSKFVVANNKLVYFLEEKKK